LPRMEGRRQGSQGIEGGQVHLGHRRQMGRSAVSRLRDHLAAELAKKVQAHGLVIWDDPAGEYEGVAANLVPGEVRFEAFQGSWYELRQRVESALDGEHPPRL